MYDITLIDSDGGGSLDSGVAYSLVYSVTNLNGPIGPNAACNAVDWYYGDPYNNEQEGEYDTRAICHSINCDGNASDDGSTRTVTVQFKQFAIEEREKFDNPFGFVKESLKIQQEGELPLLYDANNSPIRNRAGDPISDITTARYTAVYKVTKNFPSPPLWIMQYAGKINGDSFRGYPPKTLKLVDIDEIQAEEHPTVGIIYPLTLYFAFEPDGHKVKALNEGYRAKNDEGKIEHIMVNGEKTTEPMLLTADGKKAPEGAQPIWLEYENAFSLPFGGII